MIFFNVSEARNQLIKHGVVFTLRKKRREGTDLAVHGSYYRWKRIGRVKVKLVTVIDRERFREQLQPYVEQSGFKTVEEWFSKTHPEADHLFKVTLLESSTEDPEGLRPEVVSGPKKRCVEKLKKGILPEKITLKFYDRVIEITFHPASAVVFTRVDTIDWKGELHHFSSKWDGLTRATINRVIEQVEAADKVECKFPEEKHHWLFKDLPPKKEKPLRATLEPWLEAARVKPLTEFTKEEVESATSLEAKRQLPFRKGA